MSNPALALALGVLAILALFIPLILTPRQRKRISPYVEPLLVVAFNLGILSLIQFSKSLTVGLDGLSHIKVAHLMGQHGFLHEFPWLRYTVLREPFVDLQWLFHLLLVPFTLGDLTRGGLAAAVLFAALPVIGFHLILRDMDVAIRPAFTLLLLATPGLLKRFLLGRAEPLSLLVLLVGFHLLRTGRHRHLAVLAMVYVWLYTAFPMLLVMCVIDLVARKYIEGRWEFKPVMYCLAGITAGLVINPYFPHNLSIIQLQVFRVPTLSGAIVSEGAEWDALNPWMLVRESFPAVTVGILCILLSFTHRERLNRSTLTLLLLTLAFSVLTLRSSRFLTYLVPFILLTAAVAADGLLKREWERRTGSDAAIGIAAFTVLALMPLIYNAIAVQGYVVKMENDYAFLKYAPCTQWLIGNSPEGSTVFAYWDEFPPLFFLDHHNTYISGWDNLFMEAYDHDLLELYLRVNHGQETDPLPIIRDRFDSRYVFISFTHIMQRPFYDIMVSDPRFVERVDTERCAVFELV